MRSASERLGAALDRAETLLEASETRLFLSILILVSVLPDAVHRALLPAPLERSRNLFFLAVFSVELGLRLVLYARRWRQRRAGRFEPLLLVLDLLAVISFLPRDLFADSRYFRLLRLARMLLLFGYWGGMGRDLLEIVGRRERRYQVVMVLLLGLLLSFGGAVLVAELAPEFDFDDDGELDADDRRFLPILWWSFRQVQDPGNLVHAPTGGFVTVVSLVLTLFGLLLFSFVVGIGTTVVEELVERSRSQPVGLRDHTVILGFTPRSSFLLEGLAEIYRKNLRSFRGAVLGREAQVPDELHRPLLRSFRYRPGDPVRAADLDRVDVRHAKRVLILGTDPGDPDGEVIAAILAARERNPQVDLYPDMEHERNFRAARAAGGARTHLVGSGSFLGYYLVQNVVYPGIYRIYRQLLTWRGCEIYTYVFPEDERRCLLAAAGEGGFDAAAFHRWAYRERGITFLGLFTAPDPDAELEIEDLDLVLNPVRAARGGAARSTAYAFDDAGRVRWRAVRGLIGLALRWSDLRRLGQDLVAAPRIDAVTEPPPGSGGFEALEPRLPMERLERVLICGASPRVPRVVAELVGFCERLEVTVLGRDGRRLRRLARDLQDMAFEAWGDGGELREEGGDLELRLERGGRRTRVLLLEAEWTDRRRLRARGAVELESADAVVLLSETTGREGLDGGVALDCLHIANLEREVPLRDGLRVVGMMSDPVKVDLLKSRLTRFDGARSEPRYTVLSSERARYRYFMQNVFVRGLNAIFLDLLSFEGQHLARLTLAPDGLPAGSGFDPALLAEHLLLERGLLCLGLEREVSGEVVVELDPRELAPGSELPWASVRALYVVGAWTDLLAVGDSGLCSSRPEIPL